MAPKLKSKLTCGEELLNYFQRNLENFSQSLGNMQPIFYIFNCEEICKNKKCVQQRSIHQLCYSS